MAVSPQVARMLFQGLPPMSIGDMTIEPLDPTQGAVDDRTLPPPPPAPRVGIMPLPLPDPNKRGQSRTIPAIPDDITRPAFTGLVRT